jgi:small conductance mechanosensitive channel
MRLLIDQNETIGNVVGDGFPGFTQEFDMATNINETTILEAVVADRTGLFEQLQGYGDLFLNGLYLILIGLFVVYMLHRFASRPLYRHIRNRRLIRVLFGFLYALVLVTAILLAMQKIGFDVDSLGRVAYLLLCILAVLAYFLAPFFPRLPFTLGQMITANGELGFVDSISQFHTTIRRLDGTLVFVPNPLLLASNILNYHMTPNRRIELNLSVNNDSDLKRTMAMFLRLMREDKRVIEEPPPSIFVVGATASGVDLTAFCWVSNADWFRTRSDLWLQLVDTFIKDDCLSMSLPQQEIFVMKDDGISNTPKEEVTR